jgi:2'-5' RNA ligase
MPSARARFRAVPRAEPAQAPATGDEADWPHPPTGETWHGTVTGVTGDGAQVAWHSYTRGAEKTLRPMRHASTVPAAELSRRGAGPGERKSGYTGLTSRSGMISLDVPPGIMPAIPGGVDEPPHVTVVYLGKNLTDDAWEQACSRASQAATAAPGPVDGTIGGLGVFPPDETGSMPVFAHAQIPAAHPIRKQLEDLSASQHREWHPHVTMTFASPGDVLPAAPDPTPVTFTHLSAHRGDEVRRFKLGGDQ